VTSEQPPPFVERRKFSRIQVMEATAASVLSAAVIGTAAGVGWLVTQLPSQLQQLKGEIARSVENQELFNSKFLELEKQVQEHDRRLIKLEIGR
jgi:septal ring factor EnvC (AmiA/AmiB activator)